MKKQAIDEISFEDAIIGLSTNLKDHRLAWSLGTELEVTFKKSEDGSLRLPSETFYFSVFSGWFRQKDIRIIRNKSYSSEGKTIHLIPELSNIDYLITVPEPEDAICEELTRALARTEHVPFAQRLDGQKIKSKENLIF